MQTLALSVFMLALASVAHAQATRTWVSGNGDDVNPCSRTAPCKTFAGAISKTATGGYINAMDPGGFGALTINKSITVDGTATKAGALHGSGSGITVNFDSFAGTDTKKAVYLRNMDIEGSVTTGPGLRGVRINGGTTITGGTVTIENVMIEGELGSPGHGIEDVRIGGGRLIVEGTTIRNCTGIGVLVNPTSGSSSINVTVSNSKISNCNFGVATSRNSKTVISNSVITNNTTAGVHADNPSGIGNTEIEVHGSVVSFNGTGVEATSGLSTVRVGGSTLLSNTTLFSTGGGLGSVQSYGNNQTNGVVLGTGAVLR